MFNFMGSCILMLGRGAFFWKVCGIAEVMFFFKKKKKNLKPCG